MFTPPPSPRPVPRSDELRDTSDSMVQADASNSLPPFLYEQKRLVGRRTRWAVVLVPLVVILITLSTRCFLHPVAFDVFSNPPAWDTLMSKGMDWTPHKRHPLPEPQVSSPSPTTSDTATPSSTAASQSIPTIPSLPPTLPTPFPQPFDSDLSQNFSSVSCSNFFANMTNELTFRSCRPFSLLLSSSASFIDAQRNLTLMNSLIWGTCNTTTSRDQCVDNMGWFISTLRTACVQEMTAQNAMVLETLTALESYGIMRDAACLADPASNAFCFIDAVRNTDPTDMYFYQLPLGIALPLNANPLCSSCTGSILGIYAQALHDPSQADSLGALKKTYEPAAAVAIKSCGASYATAIANGGAVALRRKSSAWLITLVLALGYTLLVCSP